MTETKKYLGRRLQELRKRSGLKQSELAEMLEIDAKHMSKLECGRSYPSFDLLDKIATVLNTTPAELLDTDHLCEKTELIARMESLLSSASEEGVRRAYKIIKEIL